MAEAQVMTTLSGGEAAQNLWSIIQGRLREHYGEATYRSWLSKIHVKMRQNDEVVMLAPTKFIRERILSHYADAIKTFWQEEDKSIKSLNIIVASPATNDQPMPYIVQQPFASPEKPKGWIREADTPVIMKNNRETFIGSLDQRFTFDNFIVGGPNELAYAAARSVAESSMVQPGCNPLFLHGGVGLGKTHLMHAIAWHIYNHDPTRRVIYLSAEKFMYQFVCALRNKDILSFKEQFRSVDVLMIDDVQFICGKDSTQEEFFHTLNSLIDNRRQVVISGDRSPSDLEGMEERIRSRLGWGLVVDVHATNYELRLGILQSKVEQLDINIDIHVLEFLASRITSNVRELEGALNKVIAHATLMKRELTLDAVQETLHDLLRSNERSLTIDDIQRKVAEHYNIRIADMSSTRRARSVAWPRQIAMYLAKILTQRSLSDIGKRFGGKDHTTVIHAVRKVEDMAKTDIEVAEDLKLLKRILQG